MPKCYKRLLKLNYTGRIKACILSIHQKNLQRKNKLLTQYTNSSEKEIIMYLQPHLYSAYKKIFNTQSAKFKLSAMFIVGTLGLTACQSAPSSMMAHQSTSQSLTQGLASQTLPTNAAKDKTAQSVTSSMNGVQVIKNIAYGADARQRLDIYTPADGQRHPVLVFVYGGSWQSGKRQTYAFVGKQFAKAGYTTVVVDYRLAPTHVFPDYVLDTANAMGWVYRHINQYGGNPDQLFVMGHSAGAFNVVSAVDDKRFWSQAGIPDKAVVGVIGLAGPYDYNFRVGSTQVAFPKDSTQQQVMPVYHIRQGVPPHLLVTGSKDTVVYPQNADSLQQAIVKAGGNVERIEVPASHAGIVIGLARPLQPFYPTFNKVNAFMQRHLPTGKWLIQSAVGVLS